MEAARDDGAAAARGPAALSAELSDARLVAQCRSGDEQAWRALVERFSRYVYAISVQAFRLPAHDAEDIFQEVFARVYERLETLREDEAVRPWIGQLTRRLCIDRLRAGSRETVEDVDELRETAADDVLSQSCPPARSPAASPTASRSYEMCSREEIRPLARPVSR